MTFDDVKEALTKYHDFKRRLENANLELIAIITKQTKTGGSIIKMPENPQDKTHFQLRCIEEKDIIHRKAHYWQDMIILAEGFIRQSDGDIKTILIDKYIKKMNWYDIEAKYGISRQAIEKSINKAIEKYAKKEEI
jgi:hypothetical protein